MDASSTLEMVRRGRLVAIIRGDFREYMDTLAAILLDNDILAVEITMNSPNATQSIEQLSANFGDRMAIGAGTVLSVEQVGMAAQAGAGFIVSPNRNLKVIEETKHRDLVSIPGCFTLSEVVEALDAGADAVKLFPASAVGPSYLGAIFGPLGSSVRVVPTGGVTPETARLYLKAGAWAVGVGSELFGRGSPGPDDLGPLSERAEAFAVAVGEE